MDVFNPSLTVREALRFSAKLRQEPSVPLSEKFDYVEKILEMMEMKHLGDALIGDPQTGKKLRNPLWIPGIPPLFRILLRNIVFF